MKKVLFAFLVLSFIFTSCGKKEEEKKEQKKTTVQKTDVQKPKVVKIEPKITIPIHKIKRLNTDSYVQVYLSYMEHQILWTLLLQKKAKGQNVSEMSEDNSQSRKLMAHKQKLENEFFTKWGISKGQFEQFAQKNHQAIQKAMMSNPDVQKHINRIQKINQRLYGGEESDDYDNEQNENSQK